MFFSPELLARRDSGMGLLWLAATLGSKSAFRKLHKRSVMSADISQLCDQIAEPPEPLALRLSSNLMVGVVRVYKVKQEIFLTDVTTCFNALKKMVQELHSGAVDAQIQMAQTSARPSAVTLTADPGAAFLMDFHAMIADWDEHLNIGNKSGSPMDDGGDEDFVPEQKAAKKANKNNSLPENIRAELCTLKENHDDFFSTSFDASFHAGGGVIPSSSQMGGGFGFGDDDLFGGADVFDVRGALGAELARELGDGWGSPAKERTEQMMDVDPPLEFGGFDAGGDFNFDLAGDADPGTRYMPIDTHMASSPLRPYPRPKANRQSDSDKENIPPSLQGSINVGQQQVVQETFFQSVFAQENEERPEDTVADDENVPPKKAKKRTRLLLDARTELTDEELKAARTQYLKEQDALRREILLKKFGKEGNRIIDDMVWGIPSGIQAQVLIDFWLDNFRVQVEARSGAVKLHTGDEPSSKRRKVEGLQPLDQSPKKNADMPDTFAFDEHNADMAMDVDMGMGLADNFYDIGGGVDQEFGRLPSSEDPGQGRRVSRPPSAVGSNIGLDIRAQNVFDESQRSSLFPWDNAGASSSVAGAPFGPPGSGSNRASVDRVEIRLRSTESPLSRRESPRITSLMGSATGKIGFSPMSVGKDNQLVGDDFAFDIPADNSVAHESQPDVNLATLERNSFNFLEYAKMQHQTLPSSSSLTFDDIVPKATTTRHIAAAAFYHCLVLVTKDLLQVQQDDAYGPVAIAII